MSLLVVRARLDMSVLLRIAVVYVSVALAALALCPYALGSDAPLKECKAVGNSRSFALDIEANVVRKGESGRGIPYNVLNRQRLRELSGYCITQGRRYRFSTEVYGLTVEFTDGETRQRLRFRCEATEDATPAALTCDREVRTIDWQAPSRVFDRYR
jgi:hypothetical protein